MAKKAFLVGIKNYPGSGSDLKGCVNDVTNLRDLLLKYFGFGVKEVRVLTDRWATKANIIQRLEWMVAGAKAGDLLILTPRPQATIGSGRWPWGLSFGAISLIRTPGFNCRLLATVLR